MINSFHYRFNTLPSCTLGIRRRRDKLGIAMYYSRRPRWQRYDTTQGCRRIHRRAIAIGWFRGGCRRPRDRFRAVRATPRGAYARGLRRAIYRPSRHHRGGGGGGYSDTRGLLPGQSRVLLGRDLRAFCGVRNSKFNPANVCGA